MNRMANYRSHALLAATTLVVAACGGGDKGGGMPQPATNTAPVITAIADVAADQDTTVGPITFGVGDRESAVGMLKLAVSADSTSVFPADGIALAGSGEVRTLTLTPFEAASGSTMITLKLTDPAGAVAVRTFRVTVNERGASMRSTALTTFAKAESDAPTAVNGYTFAQDADDPAIFEPLIGAE